MKHLARLLAFCLLVSPAAAMAQSAPSAPPQGPRAPHGDLGAFRQVHDQMAQAHRSERAKILAALTPAHRALLASIVGGMAVAANPDPKAAAAKLDAALSANEKNAVLSIHQSTMTQMHAAMEKAHAQFLSSLTPEQQQQMQGHMDHMQAHMGQMHGAPGGQLGPPREEPSAGQLVLMIASSESGSHMMPFGRSMQAGPGMRCFPGVPPPGGLGMPPMQPMPAPTST